MSPTRYSPVAAASVVPWTTSPVPPENSVCLQAKHLRLLPWGVMGSNCRSWQSQGEAKSAKMAILETFDCKSL